jgi:hypothetical protein
MSEKPRSTFLAAASLPPLSRWQRWMRLQFGDAPTPASVSAQAIGHELTFELNAEIP